MQPGRMGKEDPGPGPAGGEDPEPGPAGGKDPGSGPAGGEDPAPSPAAVHAVRPRVPGPPAREEEEEEGGPSPLGGAARAREPRCAEAEQARPARPRDPEQSLAAPGAPALPEEGEAPEPSRAVSLSEILRMVQQGQDIPGLEKLHITATCREPTASQIPRRPKPWETRLLASPAVPSP
ncbi:peroxisomal biogenesis factor 39 [Phascolarctos cinereus]|uniref:Uncharacterized protein C6orf226 homolog n=1 Tax=Phascolarctos cinereus TaxID=38626 RepID=A0A6P5JGI2_PHACI|nr:uncharacterized protein C6orf226 homolog [Phascolarctos cinereus]